jgi:putative transposon-encoded protein
MSENTLRKTFYRRAIPLGNSSGVLLPKSMLGADVRVTLIRPPRNIKKDTMTILAPILEHILGVYLITNADKKVDILAVSTNVNRHMDKGRYAIDVVPLNLLRKSMKENKETIDNIKKAKTIINAKLLAELRKEI